MLFGPNGSGKSSLLSVVCWVLTGKALTDSPVEAENAPLYTVPTTGGKGSRIRDWPVVVTLPEGSACRDAAPECWAEITLRDATGGREVLLRRTFGAVLKSKEGHSAWELCERLGKFSISPLDIQLSLIAPTVFGRQTIEMAANTRDILSLMLGYDDLEGIGELCTKVLGNRTRAANKLKTETDRMWLQIRETLAAEVERLPDGAAVESELRALAGKTSPSTEDIEAVGKKVSAAIGEAEAAVASVLGLKTKEGKTPEGLADRLTVAVSRLEAGLRGVFPSLGALRLSSAFPDVAPQDQESHLDSLRRNVQRFLEQAKRRIQQRWEWWKEENAPGSKAALLLKASQFYEAEAATCPVCERGGMDKLPVADRLISLKEADPELAKELRTFFEDLQAELQGLVPEGFRDLGTQLPKDRLARDWQDLKTAVLKEPLEPLASKTGEWIDGFAESFDELLLESPPLMPEGVEEAFRKATEQFVLDVRSVLGAMANLRWSLRSMDLVEGQLKKHVTDDGPTADSLLARLAKGKDAAAHVKPLTALREGLRGILKTRGGISHLDTILVDLEELRGALDELKLLSKYAGAEVSEVFESIKDDALRHWGKMYPESSTGMKPGRLVLGKGRDKSVEALLSCEAYEVPGQHFANAGLQRAIALAFYFALLNRHPKGLGFILLDDPILSLDDDHRERWSERVLRPRMDDFQVILATHQRQYLQHCGHHFGSKHIYELTPRDHAQRICVKPGHELERAETALGADWRTAPNIMRQYRERLLLAMDTYSPEPFFNTSELTASLRAYKAFSPPHILAGKKQRQIVGILEDPKVRKVLDPGSHGLTEASLTKPMVEDCLQELQDCDDHVRKELARLDVLRDRSRRTVETEATLVVFPELPAGAKWSPFDMKIIGRAAARSDPWVVDVAEEALAASMNAGALVLVVGDSLDPVAKPGQWVMLAPDDVIPADGDLVAVEDEEGNRLLRRLWFVRGMWVLQTTNPVEPVPCRISSAVSSAIRKVIGVVYLGTAHLPPATSGTLCEWAPIDGAPTDNLRLLRVIAVEGSSLDPIARKGQWVLVKDRVADLREVEQGTLAAVVTDDDRIGNVLKRVYVEGKEVILVSPNPVDLTSPAVIPRAKIREVWPFAGVLFEGLVAGGLD